MGLVPTFFLDPAQKTRGPSGPRAAARGVSPDERQIARDNPPPAAPYPPP